MAHLSLSFLGPFQVTLGGQPVSTFESARVRSLLAYLAVEAQRPHPREALAELLWPGWPQGAALANLRRALSNLRECLRDREAQPPYLLIARETLRFNTASDHFLDVSAFTDLLSGPSDRPDREELERAVALCRSRFLEGFALGDCPAFEEWVLLQREALDRWRSGRCIPWPACTSSAGNMSLPSAMPASRCSCSRWTRRRRGS